MADQVDAIRERLEKHGQAHVLRFWDELNEPQRTAVLAQVQAIDFDALESLIARYVKREQPFVLPEDLAPAPYYSNDPTGGRRPWDVDDMRRAGEAAIREGQVAAFTVAGGQGTRLGWNGPKGTFPASVVTGRPLFRMFAEQLRAVQQKYSVTIPWYIMTSPANDADTRAFFQDNNCFGLQRSDMFLFPQGTMPSMDRKTGTLLLAQKHEIATNPDGHGGSLRALRDSGALEDMRHRGIEHISYFQVDNPSVRAIDPLFIGLHVAAPDSSAEMSSKMVAKVDPEEKVGVFCRSAGKTQVIEYSDLPDACAAERDDAGELRYVAGSIAIHILGVSFVEKLTEDPSRFGLPFHRAVKKVPHVDHETGEPVIPIEPNAVKLETFVFDAIPLAESSIVYETDRVEEFAPIKNASGNDSAQTSHALQSERAARWLGGHGVVIPRDAGGQVNAKIEINPLTALDRDDLAHAELPKRIEPGAEFVLEPSAHRVIG